MKTDPPAKPPFDRKARAAQIAAWEAEGAQAIRDGRWPLSQQHL